ncbi:MAG TPA: chemotaxis protein CheB, partial [Aggregatilineales bacterium]|nr:chemotaxis protein CheB [Aggregatilineales bacterium]
MTSPLVTPNEIIRVLVADDSPLSRQIIGNLINGTSDMQMVGEAATGIEAVRLNHSLKPHIIAMDINMPVLDGLKATHIIMQEYPTRVVILGSAMQIQNAELSEQVTASGAVDFCEKPDRQADEMTADNFIRTLRAMSHVGVIRRSRTVQIEALAAVPDYPGIHHRPEIVLIVSSTGGPHALETIIKSLPGNFPLPIVIVQHISDEFVDNMTGWLDKVTPLHIKMAESGERPLPGFIYIAPIGVHLRITFNGRFSLDPDTENYRHIPSGDVLLESAAEVYGA